MLSNRSIPAATVIPVLSYPDVQSAAAWLCSAFGFTERLLIGDHRAQLSVGAGAIVVKKSEAGMPQQDHSIVVRIENADAHCAQARECGAQIVAPPLDYPYGERQYTAVDVGGHWWTFSQSTADIHPDSWGGILCDGQ